MGLDLMLDVKSLAAMLGIHPKTIYRWVESNPSRIPCVRLGRLVRFEPAAVRRWLERQRRDG